MKFIRSWTGKASLAAGLALTLPALAAASQRDLHVAVWGLDGGLVPDATVAFESAEARSKCGGQPDQCYFLANEASKGTLTIDHATLGQVSFDVSLPKKTLVEVDVIFLSPGVADIVLEQPAVQLRGREVFAGLPPVNDLCEDALLLDTPPFGGSTSVLGTTLGATTDDNVPKVCGTTINTPGVWYRVVGSEGFYRATTCTSFFGYDTKITVFCGSCLAPTCIAGNDDNCAGGPHPFLSTVDWCTQAGVEYLILVHGFGGQTGDFDLRIEDLAQMCAPTVDCGNLGACCLPSGECADEFSRESCESVSGTYQGDGVECGGNFVGYEVVPSSNAFESIAATGTPLMLGDDSFAVVPLGFTFEFFGDPISSIKVDSNGYLTTDASSSDFGNDFCLNAAAPNGAMFALWDDFDPSAGGSVHYETSGAPGTRVFVAQWTNVPEWFEPGTSATFQVRLYECCSRIEYCYESLVGVPSGPGDTTTGVEDATGLQGACIPEALVTAGSCWFILPVYQVAIDCPCRIVDFSTEDDFATPLVNGQDVSSPPEFGSLFEIGGYGAGNLGTAIFDSDPAGPNAGGPDPDLLVDLGNVLILQSEASATQTVPGIFDVPDDSSTGGVVELEFLWPVKPLAIDVIDQCEHDFYTQLFLWDDCGRVRTYAVPGGWTTDLLDEGPPGYGTLRLDTLDPQPGANGTQATAIESPGFDPCAVEYIEIHLGNSAALDNLQFCRSPSDDPN